MDEARAGAPVDLAMRHGRPELFFVFLVYEDHDLWIGRSIRAGQVVEATSPRSAVALLKESIDASIEVAVEMGFGPRQWFEAQEWAPQEYVGLAPSLIVQNGSTAEAENVESCGYVRHFTVCRAPAA